MPLLRSFDETQEIAFYLTFFCFTEEWLHRFEGEAAGLRDDERV
jgi:hypothetical protein